MDNQNIVPKINIELFAEYVRKSGYKEKYIYGQLGITTSNWYNKKKGIYSFKPPEIYMLSDLLHIEGDEVNKVFFP